MDTRRIERIFLTGPAGSGKTTTGVLLARMLGWGFVDTDVEIEHDAGQSVAAIFADEGEAAFREHERLALAGASERARVVVATGGGIVERGENRALMRERGFVVSLSVTPEAALARLAREADHAGVPIGDARPLLAGDALARLAALHERRDAAYADADCVVATDGHSPESAARQIVALLVARGMLPAGLAVAYTRAIAATGGHDYPVSVTWGGLSALGAHLRAMDIPPRPHIVADAAVAGLYADPLVERLRAEGFAPGVYRVPSGEASKSAGQLGAIYDWLAERRAERSEAVLALGGGVVGDLAGYAAATYLRGMPLVQVPTTLLAQVDASIGGKVAINHPRGKNLIGAFYPPRLVLADPATLLTLPERERIEGWAEVVKHGVALDAAYFAELERAADDLLAVEPAALTRAIAGSVALKAKVVEADEREGGQRALLNYGHTIGHAVEAVAGYGAWLHGEAVAVGMMVAARIGIGLGVTPPEVASRQEALLRRLGLPVVLDGMSVAALMRAALWDKKSSGGRVRWVLPVALGASALVDDVPDGVVREALLATGATE